MKNDAVNTLFKFREVPDDLLAEFLCVAARFRTFAGVTFWKFQDGSYVWTKETNAGPFRVASPNNRKG